MRRTPDACWAVVCIAALLAIPASAQNQVLGAGYSLPWVNVAPGQVLTLYTPALNVPDAVATQIPWPTTLSGVSVLVRPAGATDTRGYPTSLPILRVHTVNAGALDDGTPCPTNPNSPVCSNTQITVEIPTEGVCEPGTTQPTHGCTAPPFHDIPLVLLLNVRANGITGPDFPVKMVYGGSYGYAPHLLTSCDPIFGPVNSFQSGACQPMIVHADGTYVSDDSPARAGETISIYGVGFGSGGEAPPALPASGFAATTPTQFPPSSYSLVLFTYPVPSAPTAPAGSYTTVQVPAQPDWVGLAAGYVGLYQVNVRVPPAPPDISPCPGRKTTIALNLLATNSLLICVQP